MRNVTSWTEPEVNVLVQAWSEVEAKYPSLRCQRGAGTLHSKLFALFSRRSTFARSSNALEHTKNQIRTFFLFVVKHDQERRKEGGRLWFDLSVQEREQRRKLVPRRARGLTTALSQDAFAALLKMERVQRWLGGVPAPAGELKPEAHDIRPDSSFLSPSQLELKPATRSPSASLVGSLSPISESNTASTEQDAEKWEEEPPAPARQRSDSSTCSLHSDSEDDGSPPATPRKSVSTEDGSSSSATPRYERAVKTTKTEDKLRLPPKHRECTILIENMMELQSKKVRRAASKLRADIEGEVQRSAEMLRSIISHQFEDPESSGDVAFVTKVLKMQQQQVSDRFDQFEEKRARDEDVTRGLLGKRHHTGD
jgi:hypothetical protein